MAPFQPEFTLTWTSQSQTGQINHRGHKEFHKDHKEIFSVLLWASFVLSVLNFLQELIDKVVL